MRQDWTIEEVSLLIDNFNKTKNEISELLSTKGFDRTLEAIKTKKRDLRRKGEVATGEEVLELAAAVSEIEKEDGGASGVVAPGDGFFPGTAKKDLYKSYSDMMKELIEETKAGAPVVDSSPVVSESESLVIMISDTHIGKSVTDEDGNSVYNIRIALDRIKQIGAGISRIISHTKRSTSIDEVVLCLIGDILDGSDIYKTQAHHQDAHLAIQLKAATQSLWELIVELAAVEGIKKVRVATCRGNHGRVSDFSHEDSNYDNLLYDNLKFAAALYGNDKISIETKYSAYHVISVRGHNVLLRHEAPLTCDTSAARAKLGGWASMYNFEALLSGHYHHLQVSTFDGRYIMRNGSTVGPDNLSERMAVSSKIEQLCFGVSSKRLPTFLYPITLD